MRSSAHAGAGTAFSGGATCAAKKTSRSSAGGSQRAPDRSLSAKFAPQRRSVARRPHLDGAEASVDCAPRRLLAHRARACHGLCAACWSQATCVRLRPSTRRGERECYARVDEARHNGADLLLLPPPCNAVAAAAAILAGSIGSGSLGAEAGGGGLVSGGGSCARARQAVAHRHTSKHADTLVFKATMAATYVLPVNCW